MAKPDFLSSPHTHTRVRRCISDFHAQSYRDLNGERRIPRPTPLRRALGDLFYLAVGAFAIGGWVALIVIVLDRL